MEHIISQENLAQKLQELQFSFDQAVSQPIEFKENKVVKYISFQLGTEIYGWPLLNIKEIMPKRQIVKIPGKSTLLHGIINYKNQIVTIKNFHHLFNLAVPETEEDSFVIVTKGLKEDIAFLSDRLIRVLPVEKQGIREKTSLLDKSVERYIEGEIYDQKRLVILLRPGAFNG